MSAKLRIERYNEDWPRLYDQERERLMACLKGLSPRVEHIGSTAVQGLGSKPVIDLLVGYPPEQPLKALVPLLLAAGYCHYACYDGRAQGRAFFARLQDCSGAVFSDLGELPNPEQHPATHHLHLAAYGSAAWKQYLYVRDYLRQHPIARDAYHRMKVKLEKGVWESQQDYAQAKRAFISRIERLAELGKGG